MTEADDSLRLEVGHVLFIDLVGYSKLLIEEQKKRLRQLTDIVLASAQVRESTDEQLVRLPTGDGMALVFRRSAEEPARCALEIAQALKARPDIPTRMGIHSGPVSEVTDVSGRTNIAGAGINTAQRVMDCGDAGHILLSKHVAEDLEQYGHWKTRLHDLGDCEVKHGVRLGVVNLYTDGSGNPQLPRKFRSLQKRRARRHRALVVMTAFFIGAIVAAFLVVSRQPAQSTSNVPEKSIAVLPFENLSEDKENTFFTDGVQDEILTDLAKIADLKVISRRSVMAYRTDPQRNLREIAQQLGVAHILEGSVQRTGNKVRVNAQLVDARRDAHVWAQTYDRELADVFAIQSEIAKAIADQLRAKLSPAEKAAIERPPTADLAAFDLYTRAKVLLAPFARDQALQAIGLLNQALTRDPEFLLAYCKLAAAHDLLYFHGRDPTAERLALAQSAVDSALRLRPASGEAHLALALHLYSSLDYDRARTELAIVHRILPNDAQAFELSGNIDRRQGRWEESVRNFKRAVELDPRNVETLQQLSYLYQALRRYPEMAAVLNRALEIAPKDVDTRVARAFVDLLWRADGRPLHATIEAILADDPASAPALAWWWVHLAFCERDPTAVNRALVALSSDSLGPANVTLNRAFGDGLLARVRGDAAAAHTAFVIARAQQEEVVRGLPDYAPALCALGLIDAGLGRKEEALSEGRRAVELLPVEKDAIVGADLIEFFAIICAWAGEKDLALEQLAAATRIPCRLLSYGVLRLHPFWDPLRGDPRFEKIIADLAPQDGAPANP